MAIFAQAKLAAKFLNPTEKNATVEKNQEMAAMDNSNPTTPDVDNLPLDEGNASEEPPNQPLIQSAYFPFAVFARVSRHSFGKASECQHRLY